MASTLIIDGKAIAAQKLEDLRSKIQDLKRKPKLVIVLVGNDAASVKYVALKRKRGEEVGINVEVVDKFPQDSDADGIIVQLPLPAARQGALIDLIPLSKDVDGLRPGSSFLPATVKAILTALSGFDLKDKTVTVIGQGAVGKPAADALEKLAAKVNRADKNTPRSELLKMTREADVLISATGIADLVTAEMVKRGAVLIDVGWPKPEITAEAAAKSRAFTPVPGGIGPLTVVSLLENTYEAAMRMGNEAMSNRQ